MKRSQINRGTSQLKRGRVKPMSKKRQAERDDRRAIIELVHKRDGTCVAAAKVWNVECAGPMDVDEVIPRSGYPGGHLDLDNCQLLCRAHHDWKHAYPERAHQLGLRKWSHERWD